MFFLAAVRGTEGTAESADFVKKMTFFRGETAVKVGKSRQRFEHSVNYLLTILTDSI